jgi:hypothetical protein
VIELALGSHIATELDSVEAVLEVDRCAREAAGLAVEKLAMRS